MVRSISVFLIWGCVSKCSSLSAPTAVVTKPIQRVAVIGSGIAGLSVAHALQSSTDKRMEDFVVCLYDSRPKLDANMGSGIQLSGGLAVLGMINPEVQQKVYEAGLPTSKIQSRCKPWGNNNNKGDDFDTLLEIDLKQAVMEAGEEMSQALIKSGQLQWTSIMRGTLQDILYKTLPKKVQQTAKFGKNLVDIRPVGNSNGQEVECVFADGTIDGPFDIIIGCDGVKSACKEFIETGRISEDSSTREGDSVALYSGLRIRYAVQKAGTKPDKETTGKLTQYFGDGGYGLRSNYGAGVGQPNTECAFLVYLDDNYIGPFRKKDAVQANKIRENADWSQDIQDGTEMSRKMMLEELETLRVPTADLEPVVQKADSFFELGVYFHNPFSLKGWSREVPDSSGCHVVLVGDSAHALPPFLGQGSNQAIQDAYCLGKQLCAYNELARNGEDVSLRTQLKVYEDTRWFTCFQIFLKSTFLGYLEVGGEQGLYAKFRDLFFKTMGIVGVAKKILLGSAIPKV